MRVMLALGGNAMTSRDGGARPEDQIAAARVAMAAVADLLTRPEPVEVVLTHGNGPQVGNLLVKNELAAAVVPPVPLDWCGAQTQATLGNVLVNALDDALRVRGGHRPSAALMTRTLVAADDPGFTSPTKPIGRFVGEAEALTMIEHGEFWEDRGEKGWRRMVASPEPVEILDAPAVLALIDAGFVVVAAGGGGHPDGPRGRGLPRRRGGHRQGPHRRPAGAHRRRRRAGDRHRRPPGGAPLRHSRGRAAGPGDGRGDARARGRGPLRRRVHGPEGRGRRCASSRPPGGPR